MKDYRDQLRKLLKQPHWKIVLFVLVVHALLLWQTAVKYTAQSVSAHWVRQPSQQPPRLAGVLLAVILLTGFYTSYARDPRQALLWALAWGLLFSVIVILQSIQLIFRRRHSQSQSP